MNPTFSLLHADVHNAERHRAANRRRNRSAARSGAPRGVVVRLAGPADAAELRRLEELEGRSVPPGPALVVEQGGAVHAVLPLDDSAAIADPFRRTAEMVELLLAERRRMRRGARPRRGRRLLAALMRRSGPPVPAASAPVVPGSEALLGSSAWRC